MSADHLPTSQLDSVAEELEDELRFALAELTTLRTAEAALADDDNGNNANGRRGRSRSRGEIKDGHRRSKSSVEELTREMAAEEKKNVKLRDRVEAFMKELNRSSAAPGVVGKYREVSELSAQLESLRHDLQQLQEQEEVEKEAVAHPEAERVPNAADAGETIGDGSGESPTERLRTTLLSLRAAVKEAERSAVDNQLRLVKLREQESSTFPENHVEQLREAVAKQEAEIELLQSIKRDALLSQRQRPGSKLTAQSNGLSPSYARGIDEESGDVHTPMLARLQELEQELARLSNERNKLDGN